MKDKKLVSFLLLLILNIFPGLNTSNAQASRKPFKAPPIADEMKNPLAGDANSIIEGKKTYITYCAACHGDKGRGDGVAAAGLQKQPADHTSAAVQSQTDGAIFWKISNGNNPMPAYTSLTQTQRWQLVNYIRTLAKTAKKSKA